MTCGAAWPGSGWIGSLGKFTVWFDCRDVTCILVVVLSGPYGTSSLYTFIVVVVVVLDQIRGESSSKYAFKSLFLVINLMFLWSGSMRHFLCSSTGTGPGKQPQAEAQAVTFVDVSCLYYLLEYHTSTQRVTDY
jgi:hypothetical protein